MGRIWVPRSLEAVPGSVLCVGPAFPGGAPLRKGILRGTGTSQVFDGSRPELSQIQKAGCAETWRVMPSGSWRGTATKARAFGGNDVAGACKGHRLPDAILWHHAGRGQDPPPFPVRSTRASLIPSTAGPAWAGKPLTMAGKVVRNLHSQGRNRIQARPPGADHRSCAERCGRIPGKGAVACPRPPGPL